MTVAFAATQTWSKLVPPQSGRALSPRAPLCAGRLGEAALPKSSTILGFLALTTLTLAPARGFACAACYGKSDGPLAAGMNWGILSLLGVIVFVLGGVAAFFVFLARRASRMAEPRPTESDVVPAPTGKFKPALASTDDTMSFRGQMAVPALARRRRACGPRRSRKTRPEIPASRP